MPSLGSRGAARTPEEGIAWGADRADRADRRSGRAVGQVPFRSPAIRNDSGCRRRFDRVLWTWNPGTLTPDVAGTNTIRREDRRPFCGCIVAERTTRLLQRCARKPNPTKRRADAGKRFPRIRWRPPHAAKTPRPNTDWGSADSRSRTLIRSSASRRPRGLTAGRADVYGHQDRPLVDPVRPWRCDNSARQRGPPGDWSFGRQYLDDGAP